MQFPQADLRTKEDGEECEEFLAAEAQVVVTNHIDIRGFSGGKNDWRLPVILQVKEAVEQLKVE